MAGSPSALLALLLLACAATAALGSGGGYGEGSTYACYTADISKTPECTTIIKSPPAGYPKDASGFIPLGEAARFCAWAGAPNEADHTKSYVYADPVDCAGFYSCLYDETGAQSVSAFQRCNDGLLYNMQADECEWANEYTCPPIESDGDDLPSGATPSQDQLDTATGVVCKGVAYDGYLSRCTVWFDNNADGIQATTEPTAQILNGAFVVPGDVVPASLGVAHVIPASGSATALVTAAQLADPSAEVPCYDMATMKPMRLPLAAPWPTSCQVPIVISPLTTLMAYGATPAELTSILGLSSTFSTTLGKTDTFKAALRGDPEALRVVQVEQQLVTIVSLFAEAFSTSSGSYTTVAALAFKGIQIAIRAQSTSGQRRLLAASLDLTSGTTVTGLMSSTLTLAQATIPADYYRATLSPTVLQAIGNAVAVMNAVTASSTSVEAAQKTMVVVSNTLAAQVVAFASGTITADAFNAATTQDALSAAVQAATLAGELNVIPDEETDKKSNTGAIVGGVVGGVGGALVVCAAAFLAYKLWWKQSTPAQFQQSSAAYDATNTYQAPAVAQPAALAPENPWR